MENTIVLPIKQKELSRILPQAYPFIMIDEVVEFERGKSLTAIKNITGSEWIFNESEYKSDVFPETLLIEAAAQAALVLYHLCKIQNKFKPPRYFLGKILSDFQSAAHIGDVLIISALANKMLDSGGYSQITLKVNGNNLCVVDIVYSVIRN